MECRSGLSRTLGVGITFRPMMSNGMFGKGLTKLQYSDVNKKINKHIYIYLYLYLYLYMYSKTVYQYPPTGL